MNPRFQAEEVGGMDCVEGRESDGLITLEGCCGSPIRRNSILEGLRVRWLDDIEQDMRDIVDSKLEIAVLRFWGMKEMKSCVSSA